MHKKLRWFLIVAAVAGTGIWIAWKSGLFYRPLNPNPRYTYGQILDSIDHVYVYYNGDVGNSTGRNRAPDGYNLGMKYQCVEFVKRYYYQHYRHKMPDSYGNAKDFFDASVSQGALNKKRGLRQYRNGGNAIPRRGDLIIMNATASNPYGHVAIVSDVKTDGAKGSVEIIQQNPGPFGASRVQLGMEQNGDRYTITSDRVMGWLRMP